MVGNGFGSGAFAASTEEFERLARQYWGAWGDAMRNAVPGAAPPDPVRMGTQAWQDAIDWWTRQATGRPAHDDVLWRFNRQASDWYAQMQRVAAQFSGTDNTASDVARAWKEALGGAGVNVFADMLKSMAGKGLHGAEQWSEDIAPWLHAMNTEGSAWLRMPAFGFTREHQERAQALAEAQLEYQEASNAFNSLMLKSSESAFELFERMLADREAPGLQISSPRALFDLWVDAAEQAYAETALSKEYRVAYGNLVNAQMKLRSGVQKEVEQASALLGMPTRSELDGAHRKIVELERALRKLRDAAAQGGAAPAPAGGPGRGVRKSAPKKATATKPASSKRAGGKTAARQEQASSAKGKTSPPARAGKASPAAPAVVATTAKAARRPARKVAQTPFVRAKAPTNGFSMAIPVAPVPLSRGDDA